MNGINPIDAYLDGRMREIVGDILRHELEAFLPRLQAAAVDTPKGKYMTKKEVSQLCKISQRTVENRMAAGAYRYVKEGNRVRILADDVQKNMDRHTIDNRFRNVKSSLSAT